MQAHLCFVTMPSRCIRLLRGGKVSGLDSTGRFVACLGHETDLTFAFPLYEQGKALAGYSLFLPGEFVRSTQGPQAAQFGCLQTPVAF